MAALEATFQPATGQVVGTTEMVLAVVTIPGAPQDGQGVFCQGSISFTAGGTTGACTLRVRQVARGTAIASLSPTGTVLGTPVASVVTVSVVNTLSIAVFDPAPVVVDPTYALTATFATAGATLSQTTLNVAVMASSN